MFSGTTNGVPVSVCSTGIGGSSAAIALEELRNVGAELFIRVGSAEAGGAKIYRLAPVVVVTAAYRGDGVSDEYLPLGFPAVADLDVNNALIQAAKELGYKAFTGIGTTRSAYYARHPELNEQLRQAGVVAAEMEAATLFIVGALRGAKVGCVVATDSNIYLEEQPTLAEKEALYMQGEQMTIGAALRAVELLEGAILMEFDALLVDARIADVFRYRLFEGWIGIRDGRFIAVEAGDAPGGIRAAGNPATWLGASSCPA